jgi:hypothetical protein
LFDSMKEALTSSPVLARFDSSTPVFLKTYWSASDMGFILMQPDCSEESLAAIAKLVAGEDNEFDASMTGARLGPVLFGSRKCGDRETHYHSMVGEAACGQWAFGKLKKYLYGTHFWWICDYDGMRILFGYDGPIKQLRRWGQEMLGYNCTLLHRSHKLMRDVDAINRRYETGLIKTYMMKEAALYNDSLRCHPNAYAIPNLRYVDRHLAADPPPISDINAREPVASGTLMITLSSPIKILRTEHCKPFKLTCVTETYVNKLVMHSKKGDTIVWASLDTGFPTVP